MASPQPQPPQQPVYQRDLSLILDRVHTKFVEYANAKDDALAAQMRVGFAEAYQRDDALLKRIENVETTLKTVIDLQREMMNTMQSMQQTIQAMQQDINNGFASLNERFNEMNARVLKLEGREPPNKTES